MITLLVMTDGRKRYIKETIAAADSPVRLFGPVSRRLIHDDSGDESYARWLHREYGDRWDIYSTGRRSGFGGAIISAWEQLQNYNNEWVFHLEDDFIIQELIPLSEITTIMDRNPHIVQMALRRQPWNDSEKAAGGIIEQDPDSYVERDNGLYTWLEHRNFFTTNPSLYRKSLLDYGWPTGNSSEGKFTHKVFNSDSSLVSGYWGGIDVKPQVIHIGDYRNGAGY